jgi:uncharacterized membrane protein YdjX (TVP38/TMEM64 family)
LALVVGVVFFSGIDYTQLNVEKIKAYIDSLGYWGPLLYIIFYIVRPLILFPAGLLTISGGAAFGPLYGTIYTVIGATICAIWEFLVARYVGRDTVKRWLGKSIEKIDTHMEKHGLWTLLLIRLIPNLPYDVQNYGLGLTRIGFWSYTFGTFFGIMPGTFAFCYLGGSLAEGAFGKILIAVGIIIVLIVLQRWYKKRKTASEQVEEAALLHNQHVRNEETKGEEPS